MKMILIVDYYSCSLIMFSNLSFHYSTVFYAFRGVQYTSTGASFGKRI